MLDFIFFCSDVLKNETFFAYTSFDENVVFMRCLGGDIVKNQSSPFFFENYAESKKIALNKKTFFFLLRTF